LDPEAAASAQASPPDAAPTSGWLHRVPMKLLVAGMAALGVLAMVYPDGRRSEISAAAEAIHQCDLAAARSGMTGEARQQARTHCHALRADYLQRYGQEP